MHTNSATTPNHHDSIHHQPETGDAGPKRPPRARDQFRQMQPADGGGTDGLRRRNTNQSRHQASGSSATSTSGLPAPDRESLSALLGQHNIKGHRAAQESLNFFEGDEGQHLKKVLDELATALGPKKYHDKLAGAQEFLEKQIKKLNEEDRFVVEELVKRTTPKAESYQSGPWPNNWRDFIPQVHANRYHIVNASLLALIPIAVGLGIQKASVQERETECEDLMGNTLHNNTRAEGDKSCSLPAHSEYLVSPQTSAMAYAADAALTLLSFVSDFLNEAVYEQRTARATHASAAAAVTPESDRYALDSKCENIKKTPHSAVASVSSALVLGLAAGGAIGAAKAYNGEDVSATEALMPMFVLVARSLLKSTIDLLAKLVFTDTSSGMGAAVKTAAKTPAGALAQIGKSLILNRSLTGSEASQELLLGIARGVSEEAAMWAGQKKCDESATEHEERRDGAMHGTMKAVMDMRKALRPPKVEQSYTRNLSQTGADVARALEEKKQVEAALGELQEKLVHIFQMKPGTELFSEALDDLDQARQAAAERIRINAQPANDSWYGNPASHMRSGVSTLGHALSDYFGCLTAPCPTSSAPAPDADMEAPAMAAGQGFNAESGRRPENSGAGDSVVIEMDETAVAPGQPVYRAPSPPGEPKDRPDASATGSTRSNTSSRESESESVVDLHF